MSRSGYTDDYGDDDPLALGRWRAQVASTIRGKRGQAFLKELLQALDEMPEKKLITNDLIDGNGCVCTLGALGVKRGLPLADMDPEDAESVAFKFEITHQLVAEIEFMNDEGWHARETPEERWVRMRAWVARQIKPDTMSQPEPQKDH